MLLSSTINTRRSRKTGWSPDRCASLISAWAASARIVAVCDAVRLPVNGVLQGVIANDAEETTEVKLGQPVTLNISEISDWKYIDGNKFVGGFTIRYFLDRMSPKERESFLNQAGFQL